MIPKVIHYCWFGRNPLPASAIKCIESWKRYFPDYTIKEWNEDNFDVTQVPYIKEAYNERKYAFVSDYARFWILYRYGGIYFDTDVQVIKSFDHIIDRGPFMGREAGAFFKISDDKCSCKSSTILGVNPGLGLGVYPRIELLKELLDIYNSLHFKNTDGSLNTKTIVSYTTEVLLKHGLTNNNEEPEEVAGIWIYPTDYFCPMDHTKANQLKVTERTVSIHLYDCSWLDHDSLNFKIHLLKNRLARWVGFNTIDRISKLLKK